MNAGLLGEHLASPRTAQKTNQSTALDQNTASGGDASGKDDFASHVAKDADPKREESPATESPIAAAQQPDDILNPADDRMLALDTELVSEDGTTVSDALASTVKSFATQDIDAANANAQQTPDNELGAIKPAAQSTPTHSFEAGEVIAQDARTRAQIDAGEPRRRSAIDAVRVPPAATDDAVHLPGADQIERVIDPIQTDHLANRTTDADATRAPIMADGADTIASNAAETSFRQTVSTDVATLDRLANGGIAREIQTVMSDTIPTVAPPLSSGQTSASVAGLTPVVPTIPVASPGDLTSVILNAINNGIDPQEQLMVQLDPPELGRVMIDFKFDAQGLQQIIVTSENPEALKRLREMHYELTQALREHGLSEQNMSFRQEAGGQSQNDWPSNETSRQEAQLYAAEERRASPSALPTESRTSARDRLDLLL